MKKMVLKELLGSSFSRSSWTSRTSLPSLLSASTRRNAVSASSAEEKGSSDSLLCREDPGFSHGLSWALAKKGVIVKDKAFRNLETSELQKKGAIMAGSLLGLPIHVRGNVLGRASEISKPQFTKLLKQVTTHLSSVSDIYIHDGAIGSISECNAKARVISDNPSAILHLSNVLWKTPSRAVSHDTCPLTVYVASSISQHVAETIGVGERGNNGLIAADVHCSSLVLCGNAFSDTNGIKEALTALSGCIVSARGGIPLSARLLVSSNSPILLFAPKDTVKSCMDEFVSADAGVTLSSQGVAPFFQTINPGYPELFKCPAAIVLTVSDSSRTVPSISKISPGQAAYHFLAGYQDGKFMPAYSHGPSSVDALELAKALLWKLKSNQIPSFLVNIKGGKKNVAGKDVLTLVRSTLSKSIPPFQFKGGDLERQYKSFLSYKFQQIPEEFSF